MAAMEETALKPLTIRMFQVGYHYIYMHMLDNYCLKNAVSTHD